MQNFQGLPTCRGSLVRDTNQENPGLFPEGGEFDSVPSSPSTSPSTNIPYGLNPEYGANGETPEGTVDYQNLPSLTPDPSSN